MKILIALVVMMSLLTEAPPATLSQSLSDSLFGCYTHELAWTSGRMNLRSCPDIHCPVKSATRTGTRLEVHHSVRGSDHCWLLVDINLWMAKTSLVSPQRYVAPVATPAQAAQESAAEPEKQIQILDAPDHIINSEGRRIPLHDHDEFRRAVAAGFYYVRDALGQKWWDYLAIIDDVRYAPGYCSRDYACMNNRWRVVRIGSRHSLDPRRIAETLIHEACHMWQVRENRHHGRDYSIPYEDRPWEHECNAVEREAGF